MSSKLSRSQVDARFIAGVGLTFATEIALSALGLVSGLLVARLLGPGGKGAFALITTTVWLLMSIAQFGLPHAVVYSAARAQSARLFVVALILSGAVSILALGAGFLASGFVRRLLQGFDPLAYAIGLAAVPFLVAGSVFVSFLQGTNRLRLYNVLRGLPPLAFSVLLLLSAGTRFDPLTGAVISWFLAQLVFALIAGASVYNALPRPGPVGASTAWREIVAFGVKTHAGNVLKALQYRLDVLLVGLFLTPTEVGYYVVAVSVSELIWKLPNAVGAVLLPRVAGVDRQTYEGSLTQAASRHVTLMSTLALGFLLITANRLIVFLYGPLFEPAYHLLVILTPGALLLSVWKVLANDLIGQGYGALYSLSALVSVGIMVGLDIILIPSLGVAGAAIAASAAYVAAALVLLFAYVRVAGTPVLSCVIPTRADLLFYRRGWNELRVYIKQVVAVGARSGG